MSLKLNVNSNDPPTEVLIVAEIINSQNQDNVTISWHEEWKDQGNACLYDKNNKLLAARINDINRYFARTLDHTLYGGHLPHERTEVDHWISFSMGLVASSLNESALENLDRVLLTQTWLVNKKLTLADVHVFCTLLNKQFIETFGVKYRNVARWYKYVLSHDAVDKTLSLIAKNKTSSKNVQAEKTTTEQVNTRKQEGKFIDLPGAEMGKVVVRFPPEASGYLHIGHAKAALLNQYYAETFQGQLIMRFDDTNPAKETVEFEEAILEDLKLLQIKPDRFTHTSDYFDVLREYCTTLIKNGDAFVDNTPAHIMKEQRDQKLKSDNRDNSVEKNLKLWDEMQRGTAEGQEYCVRAKIDYTSANGCLRDPTIYRCKSEAHPRTGDKYKVYPTYDFACPIVDSIENVTHTLRTTEYRDRDPQFTWILKALGLRIPHIWEYSRLNMTHTVLSKRKLTWFVNEGLVDGWDDPRFPTVRGILRRGMTVDGLKQFIIAQGSSRSVVFMQWDKIWAFNKKVIDPVAVRYTALDYNHTVPVDVTDAKEEWLTVQNHPKDPSKGTKQVRVGPKILIEKEDAESLVEGQNATFINWGNLMINKIERKNDTVVCVKASLNLEDKNYKNTLKITWLAAPLTESDQNAEKINPINCYAVYFDHIMSVPILGKDDDFKDFVNKDTRKEVQMLSEVELKRVKKGEIIQLQRKGFFICDVPYAPVSPYSSREQPVILFHIPDGHIATLSKNITVNATASAPASTPNAQDQTKVGVQNAYNVHEKIVAQGDKVRRLKADKTDKSTIDAEIKILLALKAEYKAISGQDWKPGVVPEMPKQSQTENDDAKISSNEIKMSNTQNQTKVGAQNAYNVHEKIVVQGDKIRRLKADKANKSTIDAEVKILLDLKKEYKVLSGQDWKPGIVPEMPKQSQTENDDAKISSNEIKMSNTQNQTKVGAQNAYNVHEKIVVQGDKIRRLKADKADKSAIDAEVKILLDLKKEYKALSGQDWKPGVIPETPRQSQTENDDAKISSNEIKMSNIQNQTKVGAQNAYNVHEKIVIQGDKVRRLKADKTDKSAIDAEIKILLDLKKEYKVLSGQDWKPGVIPETPKQLQTDDKNDDAKMLSNEITQQYNKIAELQKLIVQESEKLQDLKSKYKKKMGEDCKFDQIQKQDDKVEQLKNNKEDNNKQIINEQISEAIQKQGDKVRSLKNSKADKSIIDQEVKVLLSLKNDYKDATGQDWKLATPEAAPKKKKEEQTPKSAKIEKEVAKIVKDVDTSKTGTRLGLEAKKEENFFDWYSQIITKSGMIEYYDVSGCYILRPWSFTIWKVIKDYIEKEITALGVQECYFPIFVTRTVLEKEKSHIADFAPEVAWVTKCGDSDLAEPVAIRPTSETVMYPSYAKWLKSDTELPLRLNQWNNVVRWEFKDPKPFLRTREFLWQEGHTAFATKAEADEEVLIILDVYARVYEDLLAVPVIKGRKTEKEKFAGGDYTTTVEAFISTNGRAIQGATSHHLGQNFSKMFNIQVEGATEGDEKTLVYQNSWGLTTRTIGVMIMIHGDDKGLVLPPNVASIQAIVVPCGITANTAVEQRERLHSECLKLVDELGKDNKFKVKGDFRNNRTPGWKFNHWELKGVPVRIELGPKDLEKDQVTFVRRDNFQRLTAKRNEVITELSSLLNDIQSSLLNKARKNFNAHIKQVENWSDFGLELNKKNLLLSPFCGEPACEDNIKVDSAREDNGEELGALSMGAKSLCIPFEQPKSTKPLNELKCIHHNCRNKPKFYTLFGRSY